MARIDKLSIELEAVELINIMRGLFNYSFRQLSEILDVPALQVLEWGYIAIIGDRHEYSKEIRKQT